MILKYLPCFLHFYFNFVAAIFRSPVMAGTVLFAMQTIFLNDKVYTKNYIYK